MGSSFNKLNVYQRTDWTSNPNTGVDLVYTSDSSETSVGDFWQRVEAGITPAGHFQGRYPPNFLPRGFF